MAHIVFRINPESKFMKYFPLNGYAWTHIFVFIAEIRYVFRINRTTSLLKKIFKHKFDTKNDSVALLLIWKRVGAATESNSTFTNRQKVPVKANQPLSTICRQTSKKVMAELKLRGSDIYRSCRE